MLDYENLQNHLISPPEYEEEEENKLMLETLDEHFYGFLKEFHEFLKNIMRDLNEFFTKPF